MPSRRVDYSFGQAATVIEKFNIRVYGRRVGVVDFPKVARGGIVGIGRRDAARPNAG